MKTQTAKQLVVRGSLVACIGMATLMLAEDATVPLCIGMLLLLAGFMTAAVGRLWDG